MPTLDWLNRQDAFTTSVRVPYRLLEPVSMHGADGAENLLIQGDNLEALNALLPFYRGQVKCFLGSATTAAVAHEKRQVGERWAQQTGQCFVMVEKRLNGLDLALQIKAAAQ